MAPAWAFSSEAACCGGTGGNTLDLTQTQWYTRRVRFVVLAFLLFAACGGEVGDVCEKSSDCSSDLCLDRGVVNIKQCTQLCSDSPCSAGDCVGSTYCVVSCSEADPKCPDDLVCYPGIGECLARCESDVDCSGGLSCREDGTCR